MSSQYLPREDCRITICKLPPHVKGLCTVKGTEELILINDGLSDEAKERTLRHELRHLQRDDLRRDATIEEIEREADE